MKMKNPIDLSGFIQVAIIVEDIEKSAKEWADLCGVPIPEIIDQPMPVKPSENLKYRGVNACYALRLAIIEMPNGAIIELHQCDENDSTFREYVKKHGYGVHHLGFAVGNNSDKIVDELVERGYEIRTIGMGADNSWTIIDSEDILGVNLNIKPHQ